MSRRRVTSNHGVRRTADVKEYVISIIITKIYLITIYTISKICVLRCSISTSNEEAGKARPSQLNSSTLIEVTLSLLFRIYCNGKPNIWYQINICYGQIYYSKGEKSYYNSQLFLNSTVTSYHYLFNYIFYLLNFSFIQAVF